MARSKPTEETIEKVMAAVLAEAKANNIMPELLAATMQKLRETSEGGACRTPRDDRYYGCVLPVDKRQKFLEELLEFMQPN